MVEKDFHIQWHITDNCNLLCKHCYQDDFSQKRELNWQGLKMVADNLIETMKLWGSSLSLSLTGGEPFLKKELFKLIDYLSSSEVLSSLNIITNLTLVDRFIDPLRKVKDKIDTIFFSLEGVTPEVNDYFRGEGVFNKVLKNVKILQREGFNLILMFTLLKKNLKEVDYLVDFSKDLGIKGVILERFIPLGNSLKIKDTQMISPFELKSVYQRIFSKLGVDFFEEAVKFHALKVEFKNSQQELFGAECVVAKFGCALMPGGEVFPCRRFPLEIGNLLRESLSKIWESSPVLNLLRERKNLKGKCASCNVQGCSGCRALSYALKGDYLASDPLCWLT